MMAIDQPSYERVLKALEPQFPRFVTSWAESVIAKPRTLQQFRQVWLNYGRTLKREVVNAAGPDIQAAQAAAGTVLERVYAQFPSPPLLVTAEGVPPEIMTVSDDVLWRFMWVNVKATARRLDVICESCLPKPVFVHGPVSADEVAGTFAYAELQRHKLVLGSGSIAAVWWGRCRRCRNVSWGLEGGK